MYQSNCLQLELLIDYELVNPFCFGLLVHILLYYSIHTHLGAIHMVDTYGLSLM